MHVQNTCTPPAACAADHYDPPLGDNCVLQSLDERDLRRRGRLGGEQRGDASKP